jgi:hypothetical protein
VGKKGERKDTHKKKERVKRNKQSMNGVNKWVIMELQTKKEKGERERGIRTACKEELEAKQSKAKQSKAKQSNVNIIIW